MSNILSNGTVLPSGLLGAQGVEAAISGFNRSYRNTSIKAGIVINSYASTDPLNTNKLCTEYDVLVMEQFENKGSTAILYRHCLSSQGLGSIADYFELNLRPKTFQTNPGTPTYKDQDGAIALIQCLDGIGEKAIVIGNLIHPDRQTNITTEDPQLFGEYNGVKCQILPDGSFLVSFNGATDSMGKPTDPSQGTTTWQVKNDGSYEFQNSGVDISATKAGTLTIITKADCNITAMATATLDGKDIKLGKDASESVVLGDSFKTYLDKTFKVATALGSSGPSIIPVPSSSLSTKVKSE